MHQAIERWLNWCPPDPSAGAEIPEKSPGQELTEPPKPQPERILSVLSVPTQPVSEKIAISPGVPAHDPEAWFVRGERVTVFPHCPRCASYALYREHNLGDYECLTCGLQGIEESTARRVQ